MRSTILLGLLQLLILSVNCQINRFNDLNNLMYSLIPEFSNNYGEINSTRLLSVMSEIQPEKIIEAHVEKKSRISGEECDRQFVEFTSSLRRFESWALKMIDSSSKIPSGVLTGNLKDLGVYDECVSIEVTKNGELIRGRHCMYSMLIDGFIDNISLSPTFSICVPHGCNSDNIFEIIDQGIHNKPDYLEFGVSLKSVKCSSVDSKPWDVGEIIFITILCIYLFFLIICTIADVFCRWIYPTSDDSILSTLSKFSFYTNGERLLSMKVTRGNLPGIQGIRFFSMAWVILGHVYYIQRFGAVTNGIDVTEWLKSWSALPIVIAPFTVDTFFVMSGFLLSYLFMKEMKNGRKFNLIMYYVHRYCRITPAFGALLLISMYILPRIGSGALWEANMNAHTDSCSKIWWKMLLYVQNYVNDESSLCLCHAWYLAVDMQFFWISPLLMYPLAKKPKIGFVILGGFIIASILSPAITSALGEYSGSIVVPRDSKKIMDMMLNFYIVSHTRAGPWLMGIGMGYYYATVKNQKLQRNLVILGWILAVISFAFGFFTFRVFQADGYTYYVYWEVFYAGFARHIWALGVCWLIYSSITGCAGIIGRFLALPIFMPLGRISYCIYLVHFMIQFMEVSAIRLPLYFKQTTMIAHFLNDFILCTACGFALSLLFESPFMVLEKMIRGRRKKIENTLPKFRDDKTTVAIGNGSYRHDNEKNVGKY